MYIYVYTYIHIHTYIYIYIYVYIYIERERSRQPFQCIAHWPGAWPSIVPPPTTPVLLQSLAETNAGVQFHPSNG